MLMNQQYLVSWPRAHGDNMTTTSVSCGSQRIYEHEWRCALLGAKRRPSAAHCVVLGVFTAAISQKLDVRYLMLLALLGFTSHTRYSNLRILF